MSRMELIGDAAIVCGLASMVAAAFMVHIAAGLVVLGVCLVATGLGVGK